MIGSSITFWGMPLGPSRGLFGGGLFLGSEWYPCFVIFRMWKAESGKVPRDIYFRVDNDTWNGLLDEFNDADYADKLEV